MTNQEKINSHNFELHPAHQGYIPYNENEYISIKIECLKCNCSMEWFIDPYNVSFFKMNILDKINYLLRRENILSCDEYIINKILL